MTDDEWKGCCFLMEHAWVGELDHDKRDVYRVFLDEYDSEDVIVALKKLAQNGKPFLPAVPQIIAAIRENVEDPVPSWSEVYPALMNALHVAARDWSAADAEKNRRGVEWLEGHSHPVVARFFEAQTYARLSQTPFEDPDYGQFRQKELREAFEAFIGVAQERLARGFALTGGERRGLGPAKLDSVALMDRMRPETAGELPSGE